MKIFMITLLAMTFVCSYAIEICDPDSDGQPDCSSIDAGKKFRHFWDPVHYWLCADNGEAAEAVRCPTGTLYSDVEEQCISWKLWNWTNPCPELDVSVEPQLLLESKESAEFAV